MANMQTAAPTLLRLRVDGDLPELDSARLIRLLDELARQCSEPISVLIELGPQFSAQHLRALWQMLKVQTQHRSLLGAVAVVGDPGWAFPTHLASAFHTEPVRFFERGDEAQAEIWLRQCAEGSAPGCERSAQA